MTPTCYLVAECARRAGAESRRALAQFILGLILIAATLAVEAIALIALCWVVMVVFRFFPLVGRKHRHDRWDHPLRAADVDRPASRVTEKDYDG